MYWYSATLLLASAESSATWLKRSTAPRQSPWATRMPAIVPMISVSLGFSLSSPSQYSSALRCCSESIHSRVIILRV